MSAARLVKTVDELSCLRHAMCITEQAMAEVQAGLRPGARQVDLTATLLHRVFELGAEANALDPIWQVLPNHQAELPWTVHGGIACPMLSTERELVAGAVPWVDCGIVHHGFHPDFGRTGVVGQEPTDRPQSPYARWSRSDERRLGSTSVNAVQSRGSH